jgi:hypothetical protein
MKLEGSETELHATRLVMLLTTWLLEGFNSWSDTTERASVGGASRSTDGHARAQTAADHNTSMYWAESALRWAH